MTFVVVMYLRSTAKVGPFRDTRAARDWILDQDYGDQATVHASEADADRFRDDFLLAQLVVPAEVPFQ